MSDAAQASAHHFAKRPESSNIAWTIAVLWPMPCSAVPLDAEEYGGPGIWIIPLDLNHVCMRLLQNSDALSVRKNTSHIPVIASTTAL